jgi:PAS domain S-box-containing protein
MDEFDRLRSELALPPRAVLVTTDRNGVVLSFHPENPAMIGRKLPAGPLLDAALSGGSGTVDAPGVDGLERVYSYTTLDDAPDSGLFTAVGMAPEDMLHAARRELVFNLAGIAALIVLSFAAAIKAGKVLLLRPVEQLAAIVDSSEDAIVSKDLDGVIRSWNAGAQRLFGYSAAEIVGTPITRLIPAERSAEEEQILERIRRGERVAHFETVRAARDGRLIDVSVTISPIRDAAGAIVGASKVARDISERKATQQALEAANDRLHALSARLVQMHESERDSVSYELHDEVCQGLAAITMNVQSVQRRSPIPQLAECLRVADSLLQRVRALSAGLRPRELVELGLEAALRAHAERETAANGLALDMCSALGRTRLDRDLEATAFRIVEAALDNVVAHARARRVRLELELDAGELELAVTDDGIGFDVAAVCSSVAGTGIADMKHRAGLAQGRVEILSSAGLGTKLTVVLPLDTAPTATCVTDDAPA